MGPYSKAYLHRNRTSDNMRAPSAEGEPDHAPTSTAAGPNHQRPVGPTSPASHPQLPTHPRTRAGPLPAWACACGGSTPPRTRRRCRTPVRCRGSGHRWRASRALRARGACARGAGAASAEHRLHRRQPALGVGRRRCCAAPGTHCCPALQRLQQASGGQPLAPHRGCPPLSCRARAAPRGPAGPSTRPRSTRSRARLRVDRQRRLEPAAWHSRAPSSLAPRPSGIPFCRHLTPARAAPTLPATLPATHRKCLHCGPAGPRPRSARLPPAAP